MTAIAIATAIVTAADIDDPRRSITQQYAALLPYVIHLTSARPCQGWRTATMTAEAAGNPAKREKYRCRNRARWRFTPLHRDHLVHAPEGVFCWSHLVMDCLYFSPAESRRTESALAELIRLVRPAPRKTRARKPQRQEITS